MPGFYHGGYYVHTPEWEIEVIKGCEVLKKWMVILFSKRGPVP
jgi:hypothetical protein